MAADEACTAGNENRFIFQPIGLHFPAVFGCLEDITSSLPFLE
jgi:hypothetical protein